MNVFKRGASLWGAAFALLVFVAWTGVADALPNPIIQYIGSQNYIAGGQPFTRYNLRVVNRALYPAAMFAPAPNLPPCGLNKNSSRTWVDIMDRKGPTRLYGFCALRAPADLAGLWFAVHQGAPHAQFVYIVMTDRLTNIKYQSAPVHIP
jgi:hypothetical protein